MLRDEYGTSTNIRNPEVRKNVMNRIKAIATFLRTWKEIPDAGVAIFSGEKLEVQVPRYVDEPIKIFLFRCDSKFHTNYLPKRKVKQKSHLEV